MEMTRPEVERHESGGVMAAMLHVCWAEPGVGVGDGPEERAVCFVFSRCQKEGTEANL